MGFVKRFSGDYLPKPTLIMDLLMELVPQSHRGQKNSGTAETIQ